MLNIGRMAIILIVVLTLVYVCVFLYWRSGVRERLEEDWVMEGRPGDRDTWVDERVAPKARRISRWLILFVYVLPITALSVFVYVTN
ncbi:MULTISPECIES: hypothetical protein [Paracoccaceae]|jgi:hypothetical protein|uniref:Cation/multidrug efflux pump n=1 Tax=Rhodophyticola porphyridii TaxID=1852017 RepID=A0A3L9Y9G1_9RHOB|nr:MULTISPECIES: hypothetical protein [Paracoccaceae]MBO6602570.1 hypothetical protein [Roseicyclus sp.]MBO6626381.1 hypothetical protein [Roseicyclus sp.]MBO6921541.1 hypothetical protein [Roseicyclus sp.]RMA43918.1 hypothetical protein D9R08_03090 [Rhodophyticola porphyridii]